MVTRHAVVWTKAADRLPATAGVVAVTAPVTMRLPVTIATKANRIRFDLGSFWASERSTRPTGAMTFLKRPPEGVQRRLRSRR
jgi:hypothetical protein